MKKGKDVWLYLKIYPQCDASKKDIIMDMCNPKYSEVKNMSKLYPLNLVLGILYGHWLKPSNIDELVSFDLSLIRNGCHNDTTGELNPCWDETSSSFEPVFK